MAILANVPLTGVGAGTYTTTPLEISSDAPASGVRAQLNFAAASGGTSVDSYVQTSFDGGGTWTDAIHFPQNTTAAARSVAGLTAVSAAAPTPATDGTQTVNTINQGVFGSLWRLKYVVVGGYTGGNLRVDLSGVGLETP